MFLVDVFFDESTANQSQISDSLSALLFEPSIVASQRLANRTQHRVILNTQSKPGAAPSQRGHDEYHHQYRQDLGICTHNTPTAYQVQRRRTQNSTNEFSLSEIGRKIFL